MKKWFLHILLLAGLFGVLTTSCSQEDDGLEMVTAGKEKVMVRFSIALNKSGADSRANWGSEYTSATGDEFDNRINPNQFFVTLTLGSETKNVKNVVYWKSDNINVYEFMGEVDVNISSTTTYTNAKVNVYANMNLNQETFIADLSAYPGRGVQNIPMWGVHTISSLSLTPGEINELSTIYLLRSMSKIEVTLKPSLVAEGYSITGVKLDKYNSKGNTLPTGTSGNTKDFDMDGCFNPYIPSEDDEYGYIVTQSDGFSFQEQTNSDKSKSYIIYVPEYDNLVEESEEDENDDLNIQVYINKDGKPIYQDLNSRGVIAMENLDLVRNHWYKYTIETVNINTDITFNLQYQVIDWIEINNGSLTFGGESGATHTPAN